MIEAGVDTRSSFVILRSGCFDSAILVRGYKQPRAYLLLRESLSYCPLTQNYNGLSQTQTG